jgi:hypothetical protein
MRFLKLFNTKNDQAVRASCVYSCARWPACGCPDGTIQRGCQGRTVSADVLVAEIAMLCQRCDAAIQELHSIKCDLAAISKDMATLHGVPEQPAGPSGPDLLDAESRN